VTENEPQPVIDRAATAPRDGEAEDASLQTLTGLGPIADAVVESNVEYVPLPLDSAPDSAENPDGDEPTRVYMDPLARLVGSSAAYEPAAPDPAPVFAAAEPVQELITSVRNDALAHAATLDSSVADILAPPSRRPASYLPAAEALPEPALLSVAATPGSSPRLTAVDGERSGPRMVAEHSPELGFEFTAQEGLAPALPPPASFERTIIPPAEPTLPRASASDAPWTDASVPPAPVAPLRWKLLTALAAFAASVALTVSVLLFVLPKNGALLVTVAGASGAVVQKAQVFVDGKAVCEQSPCWVNELSVGPHPVRVQAPGYLLSPAQSVEIHANDSTSFHVALRRSNTARLDVRGAFSGVRVLLDGVDRGAAPLTLNNLAPGTHTLRLAGNSLYAPFEQRLELDSDKLTMVEPKLAPLKGTLTLRRGAGIEGARIDVSGPDGHQRVRSLPETIELRPDAKYHVWASREGYQDFDTDVYFDAQKPEQELDLVMRPSLSLPGAATAPADIKLEEEPAPALAESALTLNSVPTANVIVDGRPQGVTPRQVSVAPGVHSVIFMHPTLGRKSVTVKTLPGKPATAMVRF
jgi:hypothetical protein